MRARCLIVAAAVAPLVIACRGGAGAGSPDARADAVAQDSGGGLATDGGAGLGRIDRAGRPLVAVLLVPEVLQDDYNAAPTFGSPLSRTLQESLGSRLGELDTLAFADAAADPVDWPIADGGTHPLVPMFATDVLLVDTALGCTSSDGGFAASYLDLETEAFFGSGAAHTTCGGRTPNDDVVDTTLTLLVTRGRAPVIEGISPPTNAASTLFPYLVPPN